MSEASTPNRQWPRKRASTPAAKPKRRYVIWLLGSTCILLLSGLGIAWATGYFDPDPRVVAINVLRDQLKDPNLNGKQRRELFGKMREQMDKLPENLKKPLEEQGREWQKKRMEHEAAKLAAFFKMSPEDQKAQLQKDIEKELAREKDMERKNDGSAQGPGQGGRGNHGSATEEQRINWGKKMLDNTTPEFRAQISLYRQMLSAQAASQGLPAKWNGGMGGFRPF